MDNITPSNIQLVLACDINTKFNDRCHADWSKSNLIAYVTLDGIYILKPQLDIHQGPFQIQIIRNPTVRFRHQQVNQLHPCFDYIWQTLDAAQYMEVFLDPALNTHVERLSLDQYPRRFRIAKWSPLIDTFPRQCLLATITLDYQLQVYTLYNFSWVPFADLSAEYDKIWTPDCVKLDDITMKSTNNNEFDTIRKILHSLSFCYMCWLASDYPEEGGPYLLAATITGDIVIWQLKTKDSSDERSEQELQIRSIVRTNLQYISSMQLLNNFLVISARDGQVILYDLTKNLNDLRCRDNAQKMLKIEVEVLPPVATLWHKDNIEVLDFYIQPLTENLFRIVLSKSTNICWATIGCNKSADGFSTILTMSDSYSAIDGLDADVSLHQTPATWLRPAGNRRAVMISDDGSFFQLQFNDDDRQDSIPDFDAIRTGKVDLTRMVPRGLCTSSNGQLISMISSITLQHETAKIPSPTRVIIIPTKNHWRSFIETLEEIRDENWLESESIRAPMDICDKIDHILSIYPLLDLERFTQFYNLLKQDIDEIRVPTNNYQFVKLKILGFILFKMLRSRPTKLIDQAGLNIMEQDIYGRILLYHMDHELTSIFINPVIESQAIQLNDSQIRSLQNYKEWLNQFTSSPIEPNGDTRINDLNSTKEKNKERIKQILSKTRKVQPEKCPICEDEIPFEHLSHGICKNNHGIHRCSRSLLIINLNDSHDLVCEHCSHHYSSQLLWPTKALWLCIYCQ